MNIYDDLRAECEELDALVKPLTPGQWASPTPAPGWTIAHQITHLAWTDEHAVLSARRPEEFRALLASLPDPVGTVEAGADPSRYASPLEAWRRSRAEVVDALEAVPSGTRIPWFGPPMAAKSMATARLMETWAHGQDVADALGAVRVPTGRLRHVAHIAVRARDYAFLLHALPLPEEEFHVALTAPDGETWTWGPADAAQHVTGPALDFCLLAVQRRHHADLDLTATGPDADRWLQVIQAFAGPPGLGRRPAEDTTPGPSTH